jgi:hypothetical protein
MNKIKALAFAVALISPAILTAVAEAARSSWG